MSVRGLKASDIVSQLQQNGVTDISVMNVYQVISMEGIDNLREVLTSYPEVFRENNISAEDVWKWYSSSHLKKTAEVMM